jgi:hypothetical protein
MLSIKLKREEVKRLGFRERETKNTQEYLCGSALITTYVHGGKALEATS